MFGGPVMTGGAAYGLAQSFGWRTTFNAAPTQAKDFTAPLSSAPFRSVHLFDRAQSNETVSLVWYCSRILNATANAANPVANE
jgi:hypothetical protein